MTADRLLALTTRHHRVVIREDATIAIVEHGATGFHYTESCTRVDGQVSEEHRLLILMGPDLPRPDSILTVHFESSQLDRARAIVAVLDAAGATRRAPTCRSARTPDIVSTDRGTRVIAGAQTAKPSPGDPSLSEASPADPPPAEEAAERATSPEPDAVSAPEPATTSTHPLEGIDLPLPDDDPDWIVFEPLESTLRLIASDDEHDDKYDDDAAGGHAQRRDDRRGT